MINRFGPRVGHLNYLAVLGVGIFEVLFVPVTTNHFSGWGNLVIFDLTFLPGGGEFDSNFLANVKIPPYAPPPPPPAGLTLIGALELPTTALYSRRKSAISGQSSSRHLKQLSDLYNQSNKEIEKTKK